MEKNRLARLWRCQRAWGLNFSLRLMHLMFTSQMMLQHPKRRYWQNFHLLEWVCCCIHFHFRICVLLLCVCLFVFKNIFCNSFVFEQYLLYFSAMYEYIDALYYEENQQDSGWIWYVFVGCSEWFVKHKLLFVHCLSTEIVSNRLDGKRTMFECHEQIDIIVTSVEI